MGLALNKHSRFAECHGHDTRQTLFLGAQFWSLCMTLGKVTKNNLFIGFLHSI
jgi:hypothetical protein